MKKTDPGATCTDAKTRNKSMHVLLYVTYSMSIMATIALLNIPGRRDPPLCVSSQDFFLAD